MDSRITQIEDQDRSGDIFSSASLLSLEASSASDSGGSSLTDKLYRELYVVGGGTLDGTLDSLGKATTDPMSLVKLGGSFVVGAGLTALQGRRGLLRLGAQATGVALGSAFAVEVAHQGSRVAELASDAWANKGDLDMQRSQVAGITGPLVVDTALFTAGGLAGVGMARRPPETLLSLGRRRRAPVEQPTPAPETVEFRLLEQGRGFTPDNLVRYGADSPLGQVVNRVGPSISKIEVLAVEGDAIAGRMATGVTVRDGMIATNEHLVRRALAINVIDKSGKPHPAHVFRADGDQAIDMTILSLNSRNSRPAFKVAETATSGAESEGIQMAILGHAQGHNNMFVSPGSIGPRAHQAAITFKCNANVFGGNCGSAISDMSGRVMGIMKSKFDGGTVQGTPIRHVDRLLSGTHYSPHEFMPGTLVRPPRTAPASTRHKFEVDADRALGAVEQIYQSSMRRELPPDFFHLRARKTTIETSNGPQELLLKAELNPAGRELTVSPIGINRQPLEWGVKWPGTDIPISSSRLRLSFSEGFSRAEMTSINDPTGALTRGLTLSGGRKSYLSELTPIEMPVRAPVSNLNTGSPARTSALADYSLGFSANGLGLISTLAGKH